MIGFFSPGKVDISKTGYFHGLFTMNLPSLFYYLQLLSNDFRELKFCCLKTFLFESRHSSVLIYCAGDGLSDIDKSFWAESKELWQLPKLFFFVPDNIIITQAAFLITIRMEQQLTKVNSLPVISKEELSGENCFLKAISEIILSAVFITADYSMKICKGWNERPELSWNRQCLSTCMLISSAGKEVKTGFFLNLYFRPDSLSFKQ